MTRNVHHLRGRRVLAGFALMLAAGCGGSGGSVQLASFPLDDAAGLLTTGDAVQIDPERSVDGGGSLHIFSADMGTLVNLFEFEPGRFEGDTVLLEAQMRSEMLGAETSLELWLFSDDAPPRFVREVCKNVGRTKDWQPVEVRVPLLPGEKPRKMRIAVYFQGRGHLWIDDLRVVATEGREADGRE